MLREGTVPSWPHGLSGMGTPMLPSVASPQYLHQCLAPHFSPVPTVVPAAPQSLVPHRHSSSSLTHNPSLCSQPAPCCAFIYGGHTNGVTEVLSTRWGGLGALQALTGLLAPHEAPRPVSQQKHPKKKKNHHSNSAVKASVASPVMVVSSTTNKTVTEPLPQTTLQGGSTAAALKTQGCTRRKASFGGNQLIFARRVVFLAQTTGRGLLSLTASGWGRVGSTSRRHASAPPGARRGR